MQHTGKKKLVYFTLIIYSLRLIFQQFSAFFETWAKEVNIPHVNIITILVDNQIYSSISADLERYSTQYLQPKITDSKALVIPLDLKTMDTIQIYKMLENVYFDGLEGVNSTLNGLILIGKIPLPVVNQNGYIFPTIYPYVDFLEQKYLRDDASQYFIPNGNAAGQAEIWHGLIDFDTDIAAYQDFFNKIRKYKADPNGFIGDQMRYEDFIASKNAFQLLNTQMYQNKMLFAEDLAYQRYTPLMQKLFQAGQNDAISGMMNDLSQSLVKLGDGNVDLGDSMDLINSSSDSISQTKSVEQTIKKSFLADYPSLFNPMLSVVQRENVMAGGRRVKTITGSDGNATTIAKADTSSTIINTKDVINGGSADMQGVLANFNTLLEEAVDNKIKSERYDMDIVMPVSLVYKEMLGQKIDYTLWTKTKFDIFTTEYENFYFGKSASLIETAKDLSMYRGTYRNLATLSGVLYSNLPSSSFNSAQSDRDTTQLQNKSVGASYDVFSTQVEANRGYNLKNSQSEYETYKKLRGYREYELSCKKYAININFLNIHRLCMQGERAPKKVDNKVLVCDETHEDGCESMEQFALRKRGGASPINLDFDALQQGVYQLKSFSGFNAIQTIYDIGGSKSLPSKIIKTSTDGKPVVITPKDIYGYQETGANTYLAVETYGSPIAIQWTEWMNWEGHYQPFQIPALDGAKHIPYSELDFFVNHSGLDAGAKRVYKRDGNQFTSSSTRSTKINPNDCLNEDSSKKCGTAKEYTYKIIPSIVKNTEIGLDELNGYETTLFSTGSQYYRYYQMLAKAILQLEQSLTGEIPTDILEQGNGVSVGLSQIGLSMNAIEDEAAKGANADTGKIMSKLQDIETLLKNYRFQENNDVSMQKMYDIVDEVNTNNIANILAQIQKFEEEQIKLGNKIPFASGRYDSVKSRLEGLDVMFQRYVNSAYNAEYQRLNLSLTSYINRLQKIIADNSNTRAGRNNGELDKKVIDEIKDLIKSVGDVENIDNNKQLSYLLTNFFHIIIPDNGPNYVLWKAKADTFNSKRIATEVVSTFINTFERKNQDEKLKIPGLNLLTLDRPIDSPRYVTFQSIAAKPIKFIYPDLYKVEVFNQSGTQQSLKTIEQIEDSLIIYLHTKVQEYNSYLRETKATTNNLPQYTILSQLGYLTASPIGRSYQTFFSYSDLLDAIGGESQLEVIAEMLYYQNLTNKEKENSDNVLEDLNNIKNTFNVNNKISYVMSEYLVEGNNKSQLVLPNYKGTGYEVAYINSDGNDFLQIADTPDFIGVAVQRQTEFDSKSKKTDLTDPLILQLEEVCGIPQDGSVMLFEISGGEVSSPRLSAFQCWLRGTGTISDPTDPGILYSPLKFEINSKEARGPWLQDFDLTNFTRKSLGSSVLSYVREDSHADIWRDKAEDFISDTKDAYDGIAVQIRDEKANLDAETQIEIQKSPALFKVYGDIKTMVSSTALNEYNTGIQLRIESAVYSGILSYEVSLTGDICLNAKTSSTTISQTSNLCSSPIKFTDNVKANIKSFILTSTDGKAGNGLLKVKICLPLEPEKCVRKTHKLTQQPGAVQKFDLISQSKSTVRGMLTKMQLSAYDAVGNKIDRTTKSYTIKTDVGRFLYNGSYVREFTANRFSNLRFYYQAPITGEETSATIEILPPVPFDQLAPEQKTELEGTTYVQMIKIGNPALTLDKQQVITAGSLSGDHTIQLDNQMLTGTKKNLILQIQDENGKLVNVDSEVRISVKNNLTKVGLIKSGFFVSQNYFQLKDGILSFTLDLTKKAGLEELIIEIPGLEKRILRLNILPASAFRVDIIFPVDKMKVGTSLTGTLEVQDNRGNRVNKPTMVQLTTTDNIQTYFSNVMIAGSTNFVITGTSAGIGYVMGSIIGAEGSRPGFTKITIYDTQLPQTGLNVMYLNYFGSDWGNQWGYFSDNNKQIQTLMKNSDKLISTTTQLVDESKIRQMVRGISPDFQILNAGNYATTLTFTSDKAATIVAGNFISSSFNISQVLWQQVNSEHDISPILQSGKISNSNAVFYVLDGVDNLPSQPKAVLTSSKLDNKYQIWSLIDDNNLEYGRAIFRFPNVNLIEKNVVVNDPLYQVSSAFSNGSTSARGVIGVFDLDSSLTINAGYLSIQDSNVRDNYVGFRGDFKNMSLWSEGETVGDSTKNFGSELLINIGDPLLQKSDKNPELYGTDYDGGLGQVLFSDATKTILTVKPIDFNNDGLKDLVIIYTDGSVKLAKNYGGKRPYQDLQNLLFIDVSISDAYVGDVDGNGYEDLIIQMQSGQMRTYLNEQGRFDIDGNVICLNIGVQTEEKSLTPDDLSPAFQIFLEDMDKDGSVDFITNDNLGFVKIFYGGKTDGKPNYLSTEITKCDDGRYDRQKNTAMIVTRFAMSLDETMKIVDNSMTHWKGLNDVNDDFTEVKGVDIDTITDIENTLNNMDEDDFNSSSDAEEFQKKLQSQILGSFNTSEMSNDGTEKMLKYQSMNTVILKDSLTGKNIRVPVSYLEDDDQILIYKLYHDRNGGMLESGDFVDIEVVLHANQPFVGSFGDKIQGPWTVQFNLNGFPMFQNLPTSVLKYTKSQSFTYLLDGITLNAGSELRYSYPVQYLGTPLQYISLEDIDGSVYKLEQKSDSYLDIKVQPEDGCLHKMEVFFNTVARNHRSYLPKEVDLQSMIDEQIQKQSETQAMNTDNFLSSMNTIDDLENIVNEQPQLGQILKELLQNGGINLNIDLFEDQLSKVEETISEVAKGMCNGYSFGGSNQCKGLPVPFNQAFLAPGDYHVMGCYNIDALSKSLGKGFPILFFPASLRGFSTILSVGPRGGTKGPSDGFLRVPGGTYNSQLRIYLAPTLTAKLGIAMCFGPYEAGMNILSPVGDLAGNCLVTAIDLPCGATSPNPEETIETWVRDLGNTTCGTTQKGSRLQQSTFGGTPFKMSFWSQFSTPNQADSYGDYTPDFSAFFGTVSFEMDAVTYSNKESPRYTTSSEIILDGVKVGKSTTTSNSPKSGKRNGIRQYLIDNRLDPQIRYIANNLTKMHLLIRRPDLDSMLDGLTHISLDTDNIVDGINETEKVGLTVDTITDDLNGLINTDKYGLQRSYLGNAVAYTNDRLLSNPFEELSAMFNSTNLINIGTKQTNIKIPLIFAEDINSYELYLLQWMSVNSQILQDWIALGETLTSICINDSARCDADMKRKINEIMKFNQEYDQMLQTIHKNLETLQKYRLFPFQLYERVHMLDQYSAEVTSIFTNLFGYIAIWMQTNASRYSSYIDTIILGLNIIKTYQILIDFSVNWSEKCGTCTNDTYDQYMCKLSAFCEELLPDLPILQIPSFKLPNLIFDLSKINIGLDVLLPTFNLQPDRIELPDIPNLPTPPNLSVNLDILKILNINLPQIPELPEPPELPDLPSFIPNVELELPTLPPAPQLPEIPDSINTTINVLETVGSIYCWIKNGFGLVAEQAVKAKIEQITQRTYDVPWVDDVLDLINIKTDKPQLNGFDYEIESKLDVEFRFDGFYTFMDSLTKDLNNWLGEHDRTNINESMDTAMEDLEAKKDNVQENIDNFPDAIVYTDYSGAKARFDEVLLLIKDKAGDRDELKSQIASLEKNANNPAQVQGNQVFIDKAKSEVLQLLNENQKDINNQLESFKLTSTVSSDDMRTNYETLLAKLDSQPLIQKENKNLTYNFSLFDVDAQTKNTVENAENPYKLLLDSKAGTLSGFIDALNSYPATDFGWTNQEYLATKQHFLTLQTQLAGFYQQLQPTQQTTLIAKGNDSEIYNTTNQTTNKTLVAAGNSVIPASSSQNLSLNVNEYSKGVFVKNRAGSLNHALYSSSQEKKVQSSYLIFDLNQDTKDDIIMRDKNSVYVKYHSQDEQYQGIGNTNTKFYTTSVISTLKNEPQWIEFDKDTRLKISDYQEEIKNFKVLGQSFDQLSFSRKRVITPNTAGYLMKITNRIDYSSEKVDQNKNQIEARILLVPQGTNLTDVKLKFPFLNLTKTITDETQDWGTPERKQNTANKLINQVIYYDATQTNISVIISNIERKWAYARITALQNIDNTLQASSPWSNQLVLGRQIFGDDMGPDGEASLLRLSTQKVVSSGDNLEGFVGTRYSLIMNRKDNVELAKMEIYQDNKLINSKVSKLENDLIMLSNLFFTGTQELNYEFVALDHVGNETRKNVQLSISIPDIEITSVDKTSDTTASITAELSQDIDRGTVTFQKKSNNNWQIISTMDGTQDFELEKEKVIILGKEYEINDNIGFYAKNQEKIAVLDPKTGVIKVQDAYKNKVSMQISVDKASTILQITDENGNIMFKIYFVFKELINVQADKYDVSTIENTDLQNYGMYAGGKLVSRGGKALMMISPTGQIYAYQPMLGEYSYDEDKQTVLLTLRESQISTDNIKIELKIQSFISNS